jgi:hypothetical protein
VDLKAQSFGAEIEMTGITRETAASVIAAHFGTEYRHIGGAYDEYAAIDTSGRKWKIVSDGSIRTEVKSGASRTPTNISAYSAELVTPICGYGDIPEIQQLARELRAANAVSNDTCGIHVHVDGSPFEADTLRNLANIMAAKEDLIYKTLRVNVERENRFCGKTNLRWLDELNARKPKTLEDVSRLWYGGDTSRRGDHYDSSRYRGLNLHSIFNKGTVEFRLFNSDIHHAGKIRAYITLCLAMTAQALNQSCASRRRTRSSNEKYTFRTWLLRLGLIGNEFKAVRSHLLENLDGCIAWKDPAQTEAQRERLRQKRLPEFAEQSEPLESAAPEHESAMTMSM